MSAVHFVVAQTLINATRTVFGRHPSGYIFPMLLSVKPMASGFAGVIQKLHTSDQFILFTTASRRITGASQDSLRMLGIDSDLELGELSLSRYIDDETLERLVSAEAVGRGAAGLLSNTRSSKSSRPVQVLH